MRAIVERRQPGERDWYIQGAEVEVCKVFKDFIQVRMNRIAKPTWYYKEGAFIKFSILGDK